MDNKRRALQEQRRLRAKKRDRLILTSLLGILGLTLVVFLIMEAPKIKWPSIQFSLPSWGTSDKKESTVQSQKEIKGLYSPGQQVGLIAEATETAKGKSLDEWKNQLALVSKVSKITHEDQEKTVYDLKFGPDSKVKQVFEEDISPIETTFSLDQEVELLDRDGAAQVTGIYHGPEGTFYQIQLETGEIFDQLMDHQLAYVYDLPLKKKNSAQANNQLIQEAMDLSEGYSFTVIRFPKGRFKIGSDNPDQDYLILKSNIELRGQETTLEVWGSARWYGLATGQTAFDGLAHFLMNGLTIEASDLKEGNQFIIMANHGHGWQIRNNRFTLVHQMSSHVFDLGGVQNSIFEENIFEGYAPNLTQETEIGDRNPHNFYAEAIQLDESSLMTGWDGSFMKAIDPNYHWTSVNNIMSNNITIVNNQFLPYYKDGKIVAYGATIGQHSSMVGAVTIFQNTFKETLSMRFQDPANPDWSLEPIHLKTTVPSYIEGNVFE